MKSRTSGLLTIAVCAIAITAYGADANLTINQSFVDRVVNDVTYPIAPLDEDIPCDPSSLDAARAAHNTISADDLIQAAQQKENKNSVWSQQVLEWAEHWSMEINSTETNKAAVLGEKKPWNGPNDKELADLKAFKFPVAACVTHARVTLDKRPSIKVDPPGVLLDISSISAHAHVKIFVWNPFHECTKQVCILHVCLCYAWAGGWDPVGGGFDLGTDHATAAGKLSARAAGPLVFFDPTIDRLRFAKPWDWIPLEKFVNGSLQPLKVVDVRDIKVPIDVLGLTYFGKSATVASSHGSVGVTIAVEKH